MENTILQFKDVYKRYPINKNSQFTVLDNIDLKIKKGEFCTLVGPSGCGKSTLLKLILGQEQKTSGTLNISKGNILQPIGNPDKTRGIVYQKYSLYPNKSVIDNVMMASYFKYPMWKKEKRKKDRDFALELLERVQLKEHINKFPHELSGGMQQRVAIVQALMSKPEILLMDEPFGALDPGTREFMQVMLLELWEKYNLTILFITHDLEEACYLGTRLLVLSQYYTDDRKDTKERGSKIVVDKCISSIAENTHFKTTPPFRQLIEDIRKVGFNPDHLQHVKGFDLTHINATQTLTEQENNV